MNKKNEVLVAEIIQRLVEGFEGNVTYSLEEDHRTSFWGEKVKTCNVLEIRMDESAPAEVKKNGRPAGSVKTLVP